MSTFEIRSLKNTSVMASESLARVNLPKKLFSIHTPFLVSALQS